MLHWLTTALLLGSSNAAPASYDCALRQYAMEYAQSMSASGLPNRLNQISDALQMEQFCGSASKYTTTRSAPEFPVERDAPVFYVDAIRGKDSNLGHSSRPVSSIKRAIELSRQSGSYLKYIVLREGTHFVEEALELTPEDSGLIIQNNGNEEAWISGGRLIKADWQPYSEGIFVADLSNQGISEILGLRVNGERAVRARYPNGHPETTGIHTSPTGWIDNAKSWLDPKPSDVATTVSVPGLKNDTIWMYQDYTVGIGGPCAHFDPPVSYWCSANVQGGGAEVYRVPSGFVYPEGIFKNTWKNPETGVVHVWRENHWASWMFEIDSVDTSSNTIKFAKGGFQGCRGAARGAEFYVENIFEELDDPNEWFFSVEDQKLYYFYNASSGVALEDLEFVATQGKVLLNITGTQASPVKDVTIRGVGFRDSAYTFMDAHAVPSGGDWALQRTAAVFVQGAENIHFDYDTFYRLDGNALMFSGYNRGQVVSNSEFAWIGDTAIAQWGFTDELSEGGTLGYDGVNFVEQPRGTLVEGNFIHEVGIFEKQSSFYFQAKSCQNTIRNNIMFNGPRAGINFNDGFGGGNLIEKNLIFNTVRESGDHGPFNSWDRQPFLTTVRDGTPSFTPAFNEIRSNFIIGNYQTQDTIDNDDGSNYYYTHHNFLSYGDWGQKIDYDGHDNVHQNNVYAYVGLCSFVGAWQVAGHNVVYTDNYCVTTGDLMEYTCDLNEDQKPISNNNRIFNPTGTTTVCGQSFDDYQKAGYEQGSTITTIPSDDEIFAEAHKVLSVEFDSEARLQ